MRISGKTYEEIAAMGGGIISSVKGVRNVSEDQLYEECLDKVVMLINHKKII